VNEESKILCLQCGETLTPPKRKFCCPAHKNKYNQKHLYNYKYTKAYRGKSKENYLRHLLSYKKRYLTLTLEDLINCWNRQRGICAISGLELTFTQSSGRTITNASIDRIDSHKGYEKDNVQLVCHLVNLMKSDKTTQELIYMCRQIVLHNNDMYI